MRNRAVRVTRALLWTALVVAGTVTACAYATSSSQLQSGDDDGPKDAPPPPDHHNPPPIDTLPPLDAPGDGSPLIDAPPPIDAAIDAPTGPFCTDNTMCGTGTCCFVAVCVPGTPVGVNLCFPK